MLTLALDTATRVCSVAVVRDQEILAAYDVTMGLTHSESLLPQIDQLFARTGLAKTAIEKIAVSIGPGSFTGLRIGLAAAEAMAYAWHCPICGVNTLKALAYNIPVPGLALLTLLDAQKGNYYRGCYTWQARKLVEVQPIAIVSGQQILAEAAASKIPVLLLGECSKLTALPLPAKVTVAPAQVRLPKASSVALASQDPACVQGEDLFNLAPYYLRQSEAEVLWKKRHAQ
jgi:tRNA threonylcarbamoyladenosine biosynthesis protein TsaB